MHTTVHPTVTSTPYPQHPAPSRPDEARLHRPACSAFAETFQHPLLEDPPAASAPVAERRAYDTLRTRATAVCTGCPLLVGCLHAAVVRHDVAGFVGGTTSRERNQVRRRLGVAVAADDLDALAGAGGPGPVDHDEVLRLRRACPDDTLESIAHRLGCSLSTVKRHLRRARTEADGVGPRSADRLRPLPSPADVVAALAAVRGRQRPTSRAA